MPPYCEKCRRFWTHEEAMEAMCHKHDEPDLLASFVRGCIADTVENGDSARPSSMSVVDEDRLTRRNPDWLDAKRFR